MKNVDHGVFQVIQAPKNGGFKGGQDLISPSPNGGMDIGKINPAVPRNSSRDERLQAKIISGEIKVPTTLQ